MDLTNMNKDRKQRKQSPMDIGTMVYGKVPPQAKDLEEAILGVMMLESDSGYTVKNILYPDDFYVESHKRICRAIYDLLENHVVPDIFTVAEALRSKDELEMVGGPYYITKLTNSVVSSANIVSHSRIIKQKSIMRKVIEFSGNAINLAYDDTVDPFDALSEVEQEIFKINQDIEETRSVTLDQIAVKVAQGHAERVSAEGNPDKEKNYLRSGIRAWDIINGYFRPAGIYVVAARPGMGKTDFLIQLVCNIGQRAPVGFVSAEMSDEEICQRCISNLAELDNIYWVKSGSSITKEENEKMMKGIRKFIELQLQIESRTNRIDRITSKMKFWVKKLGVKIVLIDFLQILTIAQDIAKYMTEVQALNYILEAIRTTAKELAVPVVLLSQLNRELYKRGNKEPGLSDLKGSGKIEEIAYQISFLHRPEYYEITADDMGESTAGLMYQMILKHRGGKTDPRVKHHYIPKFSKVAEWVGSLPGGFNPTNVPFGGGPGWMPFKDDTKGSTLYVENGSQMKNEPDGDDTPF